MKQLTISQIMNYLRANAYGFYKADEDTRSGKLDKGKDKLSGQLEDSLYNALLNSLEPGMLDEIIRQMMSDSSCPHRLILKAMKIRDNKEMESLKTISTTSLIGFYQDGDAKKRSAAAKVMKGRYLSESREGQIAILRCFMSGRYVNDIDWAARRLRHHWSEELAPLVAKRWQETHKEVLAYAVLRYMPTSFVMQELKDLDSVVKHYDCICARLGAEPGFEIDESRLTMTEYFYAIAKSGKKVDRNHLEKRLDDWADRSSLTKDEFGLMLWSLGKLGMTNRIISLRRDARKLDKMAEVK